MLNIIIGKRSNLSMHLSNAIDNCILVSSNSIYDELNKINWAITDKANLILNQFHPSHKLHNISSATHFINNSILNTAQVLDFVKNHKTKFNKIIYTSSSSVYGQNQLCNEIDNLAPINLYASLKLANEYLVSKFCNDAKIEFTIARVFNMYGGNDQFSFISKLISAIKNNTEIDLINNGISIRDFIHIDDVVNSYKVILSSKEVPVINVASGHGTSINSILIFLKENGFIVKFNSIARDEIKSSIADNSILMKLHGSYNFYSLEDYLIKSLNK
tara:strand:- start:685 stop:1506 length:822 start_codon:yes stop_codon:yes gene_type:complete